MSNFELELFKSAGNLEEELKTADLEHIYGGSNKKGLSQGNDGKHCTITWECSICPTHTCWC